MVRPVAAPALQVVAAHLLPDGYGTASSALQALTADVNVLMNRNISSGS